MANKRKCKQCGEYFNEGIKTPAGFFCSPSHAIEFARGKQKRDFDRKRLKLEREQRKEIKERKIAIRPRSWYVKEAQKWFNKFIRLRDKNEPCISCGRHHNGQYHAGHYRTVGSTPELRFDELNCHKQCAPCNNNLSGNIVNYRQALIAKIGMEKVEWLEGYHNSKNYSIDDLKEIIETYKTKCKHVTK